MTDNQWFSYSKNMPPYFEVNKEEAFVITRRYLPALSLLVSVFACASERTRPDETWLLVNTKSHDLHVMAGNRIVESFDHIAIGRRGASFDKQRGDDKTPLGEYRIGWINQSSQFHRFFGFTYPNLDVAKRAFDRGIIGGDTLRQIMDAHFEQSVPPQSTPLGGRIGIHGVGRGSASVHELFDWTHGCVALTNRQVDRLTQWIRRGTAVVIR
jgi:murein L,D-transpeptidase YafK